MKAFDAIGNYIRHFDDTKDITQLIIGTIAATDPLLSPAGKIRIGDARYFRKSSYEDRLNSRKMILSMTAVKFRQYADKYDELMKEKAVCVIGSKEAIKTLMDEDLKEIDLDQYENKAV